MQATDFVTVGMYASRPQAEVGRALLASEGVEATVRSDDAGGYEPQLGLTNGVRLMVRAPYVALALGLLEPAEEGTPHRPPGWVTSVAALIAGVLILLVSVPPAIAVVRAIV